MQSYVLLESYNKKLGNLGISQNVFKYLAQESIKSFKEIVKSSDKFSVIVTIRNNVVHYRITVVAKKGTNVDTLKNALIEDIKNRSLTVADRISSEFHVKIFTE